MNYEKRETPILDREGEEFEEDLRRLAELRADDLSAVCHRIRQMHIDTDTAYAILSTLVCRAREKDSVHTYDLDAIEEAMERLGT